MTTTSAADEQPDDAARPARATAERLPGLATAAVASLGAGVVHAGAIGIHAEHVTLARLFIGVAVFQLAFGIVALLQPSRWLAAVGAAGNLLAAGAWLATRLAGISWIDGLEVREKAQFTDTACALLGVVAGGLALTAALVGWHRAHTPNLSFAGLAAAALAVPALFSGAGHVHTHSVSTAAPANAEEAAHDHVHSEEAATAPPAATAATIDESVPHTHDDGTTTTAGTPTTTATGAVDPATGQPVDESAPHVHAPAAVAPVPYDPTLPIDLGGIDGVTPQEQARAENLVAVTLVKLPQWSDPATAVAAGFHSIGDAVTGFEHYIQWDWINDDIYLDPDHPESLVYSPQPDGTKKLVSAMYMLPDTVALDQVPDIGGALTQWHIHDNLCFTRDPIAPQVAGLTDANGSCPAVLQKFRPAPMIHVWITPNKCGPFSALEGVGAGQVLPGETQNCDHAHGSTGLLG